MYFDNTLPDPPEGQVELVFSLFKSMYESTPNRNLIFSPYSIISSIWILMLGASGNTYTELFSVLFGNGTRDSCGSVYIAEQIELFAETNQLLMSRNPNILKSEESLMYHQQSLVINQNYLNFLHIIMNSSANLHVKPFDIEENNLPKFEQTINSEVSKIQNNNTEETTVPTTLIPEIENQNKKGLIVSSSVRFNAFLDNLFWRTHTEPYGEFYKSFNDKIYCELMFQNNEFYFYHDVKWGTKAIKLTYDRTDTVMIIILPPKDVPIGTYIKSYLTLSTFDSIIKNFRIAKVKVTIPRFKIETTHELVPILKQFGIHDAFEPILAQFDGIAYNSSGLFVGSVSQKAVIECNENGTHVTGTTEIRADYVDRLRPSEEVEFTANRPFLFAVVEGDFGNFKHFLFCGVLEDPTQQ